MKTSMSDNQSKPSAAGAASHTTPIESDGAPVGNSEPQLANAGVTWIFVLLVAALGLTFWLYAKPDLVIMLSDRLWACF